MDGEKKEGRFCPVTMEVWSCSTSEEEDEEKSCSSLVEEFEEKKCHNSNNNNNNNNDILCKEVNQGESRQCVVMQRLKTAACMHRMIRAERLHFVKKKGEDKGV